MRTKLTYVLVGAAMLVAPVAVAADLQPAPETVYFNLPCLDAECTQVVISRPLLELIKKGNADLTADNAALRDVLKDAGPKRCGNLKEVEDWKKRVAPLHIDRATVKGS